MSRPSMAAAGPLLNRLVTNHPEAINFATGRPRDGDLPAEGMTRWLELCIADLAKQEGKAEAEIRRTLGQYAHNAGLLRAPLADYFAATGLGPVDPASLLISNGSQEAIVLCLAALVGRDKVCLSADPVYFGLIGAADNFGFALETVPHDDQFVDRLEQRLAQSDAPSVGLIYTIPDYDNPTGRLMSTRDRERLVDLAERYDLHLLEDAVYRRYCFDGAPLPTLKSLDRSGRVIHVESFSKTVLPGLRLAVMIAEGSLSDGTPLIARLTQVKSALSVTTTPLVQAILVGLLLDCDHDLDGFVAPRVAQVRRNRDRLVQALARAFPGSNNGVWPIPQGGFFLCADPNQSFTPEDTIALAEQAGVIIPPLSLFSPSGAWPNHVRLAFSAADEDAIDAGIACWAAYLGQR
ncbi:MAG: PLP-dependent aminotransferase family protein [Rhodospirillaceae bacterium]